MAPAVSFVLLALCTVTAAAPARVVTYNQTQYGRQNLQADLENILILIVPPRNSLGTALSILDIGKSGSASLKHSSTELQEANNVVNNEDSESHHEIKETKPVEIKEQNLPEPPEPAKSEESVLPDKKPEDVTENAPVAVVPSVPAVEEAVVPAVALPPGKLEQIVAALEPAVEVTTSSRGAGRRSVISAKLLGFGLAPATY